MNVLLCALSIKLYVKERKRGICEMISAKVFGLVVVFQMSLFYNTQRNGLPQFFHPWSLSTEKSGSVNECKSTQLSLGLF